MNMHQYNLKDKPLNSDLDAIRVSMTQKLKHQLTGFAGRYPAACSINSAYPTTPNTDWTTGFWSGMTWLAWQMTEDDFFLRQMQQQLPGYAERLDNQHDIETHDLGFLFSLSCVNAWRSTGDENARTQALRAADLLIARYHPHAQIIQAWGDLADPHQQGRMIIDCLMNLPLLYWASEQTGDRRYAQIARQHACQAQKYLLREDSSTYHTFYMDVETGEPLKGTTHQGYADHSCWARGQAWAIYGFTLSWHYTGEKQFLEAATATARYFLRHLPDDAICYWDLSLSAPGTARDSSAAAIAVCGLLALADSLSVLDPERGNFIHSALTIMNELCVNYYDPALTDGGYLKHAVYNMNKSRGVDEYCLWGDYFFFEAISRLHSPLAKYW